MAPKSEKEEEKKPVAAAEEKDKKKDKKDDDDELSEEDQALQVRTAPRSPRRPSPARSVPLTGAPIVCVHARRARWNYSWRAPPTPRLRCASKPSKRWSRRCARRHRR